MRTQTRRARWRKLELGRSEASSEPAAPPPRSEPEPAGLTTFIRAGCEVEGSLTLANAIRIDGEFRGRIETSESVTVGPGAAVVGDIRARSVLIEGAVCGDVCGSREVVLRAAGRLHGDVETPSLVIERGAFFNGQTRMFRPERVARQRPAAEPAAAAPASQG